MKKLACLCAAVLALFLVQAAWAHPADMYFHTHTVNLSPDGVQVIWEIVPGPMIASAIWHDADQNQDEAVSDEEARSWAELGLGMLAANIDGAAPLIWRLEAVDWPTSIPTLRTGDEPIRIHLYADWPSNLGATHTLHLKNSYQEANSISWFYVYGLEGVTFETPEQDNGRLAINFVLPPVEGAATPLQDALQEFWESGKPSIPGVIESLGLGDVAAEAAAQATQKWGISAILEGLVRTPELSLPFYLAALAIAVVLGALHALSPGHGKTIVAAYLVGSQGKAYHAIALGSIVTLTHTGSVFALGLVTLAASRYILPTSLIPMLEIASGLLIAGLGVGLLYPRWQTWQQDRLRRHRERAHPPAHSSYNAATGRTRLTIDVPVRETGPAHSHDPSQVGYIPTGTPGKQPLAGVTWRSLLTLGIGGGLVPCPDAIAILLVAVTLNRIPLGLSLIAAFSLGLALVLIIIGITMVQSQRLFERLGWFDRVASVVPVASALVVIGLGIALTWSALGNYGLLERKVGNTAIDESQAAVAPAFQIDTAGVLFTALDETNLYQLYSISLTGGQPITLTQEAFGMWDYVLSPDGSTIAYSAPREDGGTDLWGIDVNGGGRRELLACPQASCTGSVWAPDSQSLLYGKLEDPSSITSLGIPSIWWLNLVSGETGPLFQDEQMPGFNPRWSPTGDWISYTSVNPSQVQIFPLESGRAHSIPTQTGAAAVWSPQGGRLLVTDVLQQGEQYFTHLLLYELESQSLTDLTGALEANDNYPSWSPGGEWIALVRHEWVDSQPLSGDQIWLLRPDGSDAHPVTNDPEMLHGAPVWSPDGEHLLFQAYLLSERGATAGIWVLEIVTGEARQVVAPGNRPTWLCQ
ncbi:MAG: hypothetical protein ABIG63_20505 [Chloroflexota bacterium]